MGKMGNHVLMENKHKTIIMVDDDITNLTVAKNNLSGDYDVFTVPSGKKLFQVLEKVTPALILLDIEMPEMSGYDVIKILKESDRWKNIPVIFLSAKTDSENEGKALNMGATDYIVKPYSKEQLLASLRKHIISEEGSGD